MAERRAHRRLAAILAADVVGFSRLMEQNEAGTLAALNTRRKDVLDPTIAQHNGRVVKVMGDGVLVEFGSAVDAVHCAVELQNGFAKANQGASAVQRIVLRIGVNLGDVVVDGDDLLGDGVNVAARLEQLCDPGGVLVSGAVHDQMQGKLDIPLDFIGDQKLKNITRPVPAYRVRIEGGKQQIAFDKRRLKRLAPKLAAFFFALLVVLGGSWWFRPNSPVETKPSIAVIPFDNLGADEVTGRLADGITEDIITDLARFREFEVIARNSVKVYKGKTPNIQDVGRDLNVRYVLEGSIQRQGDRFRITGQLIDTTSGAHIWSERWDRPVADVFGVQAELSQQVAGKLSGIAGAIITTDREAARRKSPSDLNAYDLFVLATEAKQKESRQSIAECIGLLKQSLEIDANFARAWTLLGSCYAVSIGWADNWNETYGLYLAAMRRAVELDPLDADAHAGLAFALGYGGDLKQAETEFEKALDLNPNSADVLTRYAYWAASFGKADKGAEMAERAVRLDPNSPPWALRMQSVALFTGGRRDEAVRILQRIPKEMFRDGDYIELADFLVSLGRTEEAKKVVAEGLAVFPAISIEGWTGDPGWAEQDRLNTISLMRKAGFPPCASDAEVKKGGVKVRLPECM